MSEIAIALNRFGLGARGDESPPAHPRAWLTGQFDRFEPRPAPIAAAPARAEVAEQLADYLAEARREGRGQRGRQAAPAMAPAPAAQNRAENEQLAGLPDSARRFVRQTSRRYYLAMVAARTEAALTAPAPFVERHGPFLGQPFRGLGGQAHGRRPRRPARVRGDPAARAGPVRRHAARGRAAPGDAALSRPGPVDRPGLRGAPGSGARFGRRRRSKGAASTRIWRARSWSCTRSASTAAMPRRTSPNSPAR